MQGRRVSLLPPMARSCRTHRVQGVTAGPLPELVEGVSAEWDGKD